MRLGRSYWCVVQWLLLAIHEKLNSASEWCERYCVIVSWHCRRRTLSHIHNSRLFTVLVTFRGPASPSAIVLQHLLLGWERGTVGDCRWWDLLVCLQTLGTFGLFTTGLLLRLCQLLVQLIQVGLHSLDVSSQRLNSFLVHCPSEVRIARLGFVQCAALLFELLGPDGGFTGLGFIDESLVCFLIERCASDVGRGAVVRTVGVVRAVGAVRRWKVVRHWLLV